MRVTRLSLSNFRSYEQADLALAPGVTTLVGPNGRGKTNVVEAVRYLSTLSSHRVAADAPLVRAGTDSATIRANVEKSGRSLTLDATINVGGSNALRINRQSARPREFAGLLRTVVFAPEDLALIKGDPSTRRAFMDEVALALHPSLVGDISDYDRVVRQRSTLLKTARGKNVDLTTLDVWDDKLAALGARLTAARADAMSKLAPHFSRAYADIAPGSTAVIDYAPSSTEEPTAGAEAIERELAARIVAARPKELERGVCLVGPHRDELSISIGQLPAKGYASHGESWSAALALRLGTFDMLADEDGPTADPDGKPVLILDDVFAELDSGRRAALAQRAGQADQVLVTAAVAADVPEQLAGELVEVGAGTLTPVTAGSAA